MVAKLNLQGPQPWTPLHHGRVAEATRIDRVRCVVRRGHKYLLVQHHARRGKNAGKWSLPGGRLKAREKPKAGLRRELIEELRVGPSRFLKLGDWLDRNKNHRVFGCELLRPVGWFNRREIIAIGWFSVDEVVALATTSRLRRGFELAAILEYENHLAA